MVPAGIGSEYAPGAALHPFVAERLRVPDCSSGARVVTAGWIGWTPRRLPSPNHGNVVLGLFDT